MAENSIYVRGRGRGVIQNQSPEGKDQHDPGLIRSSASNHKTSPSKQSNASIKHESPTKTNIQQSPAKTLPARQGVADALTSGAARFDAAASKHQEAAQMFLQKSSSSSDMMDESDDDFDDDDDVGVEKLTKSSTKTRVSSKHVLSKMMSSFNATNDQDVGDDLGRTHHYIVNSLTQSGNICLICIETIKRTDPIWSCVGGCYTLFHIACIQSWIKDGVYQQQRNALSEEHFPNLPPPPWFCPKCRTEYSQNDSPKRYTCYCGSMVDPPVDPWLVPHSCGQVCGRPLQPSCGHSCLLLCHPGPCPPCPKTIKKSCHCKKSAAQMRRCGAADWSCGKSCDRKLACGKHQCRQLCHAGDCGLCVEKTTVKCECGGSSSVRPCADPTWHCNKVCGRALSCGHHSCEKVCHKPGQCGACPRSESRACPCGKTKFEQIPCTEDVPTCFETCDKTLDCGSHQCKQGCHLGPCGTCREMTMKVCKCKKREKLVQCYKEFQCDTKCSNWRDCQRHQCKRKCCDGDCPPCSQPCGKPLSCKQHKCASTCHTGPCYPCTQTFTVSCDCGSSSVTVPCGAERFTKPPKCLQSCRAVLHLISRRVVPAPADQMQKCSEIKQIQKFTKKLTECVLCSKAKPPDCHHIMRENHRCHPGRCPPCRQICNKERGDCPHPCPLPCHSAVLTAVRSSEGEGPRVGPWEQKTHPRMVVSNLPCAPCQVPVPVTCLGKHETVNVACSDAAVRSCGRPCGRQLSCTNHTCQKPCHVVEQAVDECQAGATCDVCEETCSLPRPEGCTHPCPLPCHPPSDPGCPTCKQRLRMRCHCGSVTLHMECEVWVHADQLHAARLQSCQGPCPKQMTCGHRCKLTCHAGACSSSERCTENVKVRCACKRRKTTFLCNEIQTGRGSLVCDETCKAVKEAAELEKKKAEAARLEAEEKRRKAELEEYERKQAASGGSSQGVGTRGERGGRRRRDRRQALEEEDEGKSAVHKLLMYGLAPTLVVLLAGFLYYLLAQ